MATTDVEEDQLMELEALESLFMHEDEFQKIGDKSFLIRLWPYPDKSQENLVSLELKIEFSDCYPNELPIWEFTEVKNLDNTQLEELTKILKDVGTSQLGSPMIFSIATELQGWLRDNNCVPISMHDEMLNRMKESSESSVAKSKKVADLGDPSEDTSDAEFDDTDFGEFKGLEMKSLVQESEQITAAQFAQWAQNFRIEMENCGLWTRYSNLDSSALSGRQLFEGDASLATQDVESSLAS